MWEPRRLTTLWASTACYRDSFIFMLSSFYKLISFYSYSISLLPNFFLCSYTSFHLHLTWAHMSLFTATVSICPLGLPAVCCFDACLPFCKKMDAGICCETLITMYHTTNFFCVTKAFVFTYDFILLTFCSLVLVHCSPYFLFLVRRQQTKNLKVLKRITQKNSVFWDVEPGRSCVNRRFVGTYRLHLQGRKIRERGSSLSRWLSLLSSAHAGSSLAAFLPWRWRCYVSAKRWLIQDLPSSNIPEDGILHSYRCENLKSYK
jgi:hypothetical protein